jgi:hypothetical protein
MISFLLYLYLLSGSVASDRKGIVAMDERIAEAMARRAGLERALEEFPDDVLAAAISAAKVTDMIRRSCSTPSEPWPPMVVVRK